MCGDELEHRVDAREKIARKQPLRVAISHARSILSEPARSTPRHPTSHDGAHATPPERTPQHDAASGVPGEMAAITAVAVEREVAASLAAGGSRVDRAEQPVLERGTLGRDGLG
jgi:hypothetical protein